MATEEKTNEAKAAVPPKGVQELNPEKEARAKAIFFDAWSQEHVDLVKRTCCPPTIPTDEFAMFMAQCRRSELDPLKGEADCVPRQVKVKTRRQVSSGNWIDAEEYVTKWCFQPREIGLAARADRFPDFEGIISAAVYEKDTIEIDSSGLTVKHSFNPVGARGNIIGAYAQVFRRGRRVPIAWLLFKDYAQSKSPLWGTLAATMIEKCARMAAWRRAYPNSFGDCYSGEEMESAATFPAVAALPETTGLHQVVDAPVQQPQPVSRVQQVKEQVSRRAAAARVEPAAPVEEATLPESDEPAGEAIMEFGTGKGQPIRVLTPEQLQANLQKGEEWLTKNADKPKGPNAALMERGVLAIRLELAARSKNHDQPAAEVAPAPVEATGAPPAPAEREPGDDSDEIPFGG